MTRIRDILLIKAFMARARDVRLIKAHGKDKRCTLNKSTWQGQDIYY